MFIFAPTIRPSRHDPVSVTQPYPEAVLLKVRQQFLSAHLTIAPPHRNIKYITLQIGDEKI
jgi:hypothetical protein